MHNINGHKKTGPANAALRLLLRIGINALSITVAVKLVGGIEFQGLWWELFIIGAVFGFVNWSLKPALTLFAVPFIFLSCGLAIFAINALMLYATAYFSAMLGIKFTVAGFFPALWGSIVISLVNIILSCITGESGMRVAYHRGGNRE